MSTQLNLHDYQPNGDSTAQEVLAGLQRVPKKLPAKLFYDERGSQLFDQICELDEYYTTRTESAITQSNIDEIVAAIGPQALLIEYGSGSSAKTRILLDHLNDLAAYIPLDISKEHLLASATELAKLYPDLEILPVSADYTTDFELPRVQKPVARRVVYFPGSTIGNFETEAAIDFLEHIAEVCGSDGGLLIGVDLKKEPHIIHQAYNDRAGVTAAFNLNMLVRLNRDLDMNFVVDQFGHYAFYNVYEGRLEMHLVSLADQTVYLNGTSIEFAEGESIWTESSYKYTPSEFAALAGQVGFEVQQVWIDEQHLFSVQYLTMTGNIVR
ncbi:MAG: L-histidine N(alpha)-methyltransferase [Chloroflexota bacterium]